MYESARGYDGDAFSRRYPLVPTEFDDHLASLMAPDELDDVASREIWADLVKEELRLNSLPQPDEAPGSKSPSRRCAVSANSAASKASEVAELYLPDELDLHAAQMLARDKAAAVLSCADETPTAQNLSSDAAAAVVHHIEGWLQPDVIEAGGMAMEVQMFCALGGIRVLGTYMQRFPGLRRRILVLVKALVGGQERDGYEFLDDYGGDWARWYPAYEGYERRPLLEQLMIYRILHRAVWCMQSANEPSPETRELAKVVATSICRAEVRPRRHVATARASEHETVAAAATEEQAKILVLMGIQDPASPFHMLAGQLDMLQDSLWKHLRLAYAVHNMIQHEGKRRAVCPVLKNICWPKPKGLNIDMMPFRLSDPSGTLPPDCKLYWDNILSKIPSGHPIGDDAYSHPDIAYLTIHESLVPAGQSQRRSGLHTETPGRVNLNDLYSIWDDPSTYAGMAFADLDSDSNARRFDSDSGSDNSPQRRSLSPQTWPSEHERMWDLHNSKDGLDGFDLWDDEEEDSPRSPPPPGTTDKRRTRKGPRSGIYMASNVDRSCRVWDCSLSHPGLSAAAGPNGDIEHLRDYLGPGKFMRADTVYKLGSTTPHESMRLRKNTYRQYFRLVVGRVAVWFSDRSTPNPYGVEPIARIVMNSEDTSC